MALCALIGDELTGLGFRLAGADCYSPAPEDVPALLQRLAGEAALILIAAELAAALPPDLLRQARLAQRPLVLIIPDVQGRVRPPDLAAAIRRQLGMVE